MKRSLYRIIYLPILTFYAIVVWQSWDGISGFWEGMVPGAGSGLGFLSALLGAFGFIYLISYIGDRVIKEEDYVATKETPEERRKNAALAAEDALKEKVPQKALAIYENAGMFTDAMDVAIKLNDREAQARLYARMGRYDKSFKLWNDLEKYEEAGRCATLAKDIGKAREFFRMAAEAAERRGGKAAEMANLWDRAGCPHKAAPLYEKAGDLFRAAECYELSCDEAKAAKLKEQGDVIRAYERAKGLDASASPEHRAALAKAAKLELEAGDYLAAAQHLREAGEHQQAAQVFEQLWEWERAAAEYESAGQNDLATQARAKAAEMPSLRASASAPPPQTVSSVAVPMAPPQLTAPPPASRLVPKPQFAPPPPMAPPPAGSQSRVSAAAVPKLTPPPVAAPLAPHPPARPMPISSVAIPIHAQQTQILQQYVPVYVMAAPDGQIMRSTSAQDVDWMAKAVRFEQGGDFGGAADLYRQLGQFERAGACLSQAGRPTEAALYQVAIGRAERAVKILTEELEKKSDSEVGELLGEIFIERGRYFKAMELLCRKLAPGGITQSNADLYYRFAQKFEEHGANHDALYLYRELVASGALSEDVTERVKRLERQLGPEAPATQSPKLKAKKTPEQFLASLIDTSSGSNGDSSDEESDALSVAIPRAPTVPFPFAPRTLPKPIFRDGKAVRETFAPKRGLSLLAPPEDRPEPTGATSLAGAEVRREPRAASPFAPATRYQIKRELARGGMGVVYEAVDTLLGRDVALKLLQSSEGDAEELQQFLMEARAIARLNHPNVVAVYDIGLMDLRHYIAMEMVRGSNLRELVVKQRRLPVADAMRYFLEIARGLQAAHEAGIVHRDIKPANVLLSEKSVVKLADFGLAKLARKEGEHDGEATMFKTAGTPGYMAPEQIQGAETGPQADIYALGVTLFFMLTGATPAAIAGKKGRHDIFEFQLGGDLPALRHVREDIPPEIEALYAGCTMRKPTERFQNIAALLPAATL